MTIQGSGALKSDHLRTLIQHLVWGYASNGTTKPSVSGFHSTSNIPTTAGLGFIKLEILISEDAIVNWRKAMNLVQLFKGIKYVGHEMNGFP
jgi:hypothetical protein